MGRSNRSLKKRILLLTMRVISQPLLFVLRRIKWENADRVGRAMGAFGFTISKRYRTVAVNNLLAAYPGISKAEARRVAKQTFCNFCRAFVEFFIAEKFGLEEVRRVTELRGEEYVDQVLNQGKGGILLTAHMGNWELLARRLVAEGYAVNVIARDSDDPTMTGVVNDVRERAGYTVLSRDASVRSSIRCLRSNQLLGILPDQNTLGSCIFVDFFGRPVATAAGLAAFVLRTGAAILPAYSWWDSGTKRYIGKVYPPLEIDLTGNDEEDARLITQAVTTSIENEIRKRPSEWLWLHDRWKRAHEAPDQTGSSALTAGEAEVGPAGV